MNTTPRSCWSGPARLFHRFGRGLFMLLSALLLPLPVPALAALDPSFDGDGRVLTDFPLEGRSGNEGTFALVVQPDGKLVAGGPRFIIDPDVLDSDIALARYNPDGTLDRSFDGDGRVLLDFGDFEIVNALVVQPDGRLVAAGGLFFLAPLALLHCWRASTATGALIRALAPAASWCFPVPVVRRDSFFSRMASWW
jgi:uncharacterized delta-60 repeat protein